MRCKTCHNMQVKALHFTRYPEHEPIEESEEDRQAALHARMVARTLGDGVSAKERAYEKHIETLEEENEELEQALLDEKGIIPDEQEPDNDQEPDQEPETDDNQEPDQEPDNDQEPDHHDPNNGQEPDHKHERDTSPSLASSTPYLIGALALFLLLILIMRARQGRKVQAVPVHEPGSNGNIAPSNPQTSTVYPSYTSGYRQITTTDF
jgi:uncharacterized membrane protein